MSTPLHSFKRALPFWASLGLVPTIAHAAMNGGWALLAVPLYTWGLFTFLDAVAGLDTSNPDINTPDHDLFWYRLITLIWTPIQGVTLFGTLAYITSTDHLATWEKLGVAYGLGILAGTIGIVYAHELMHQKSRLERSLGDVLMSMAQYGHFRSEHMLVHHRYVATPRDAVTARYNENFHRFFFRVLPGVLRSAWHAETDRLQKRQRPVWHLSNPFWRYATLQTTFLALALAAGGISGLGLYLFVSLTAIWQLELVNYVEHYGLTRKHLGQGKYEHQKPHHSWNAAHRASNWLLINLQRHSDHHIRPDRRYPILQTYTADEAPQLPFGYPVMTALALIPPLWLRRMNPRVRRWRKQHYPEITDWSAYNSASNPMPE
ncbi:MAG: alkane 1-monooxygenase [Silicimonas sp.]|nr:alkane 1-monooxygenase [Silicimonas sp.]